MNVAYSRDVTYNAKGQVSADTTVTRRNESGAINIYQSTNTYGYGTGAGYALELR